MDNETANVETDAGLEADETQTENTEVQAEIILEKIPEHWDKDVRTFLESVTDPNGRNSFTKSFKNFESGWQKKFQDVSENRKRLDSDLERYGSYVSFGKSLTPEQTQGITGKYGTVGNYLNELHRVFNYAEQNPMEFILEFANSRKLDADRFVDYLTKGIVPKVERPQEVNVEEIKNNIRLEIEKERIGKEIVEFEKTHEHFSKVRHIMAGLAQANPGRSLDEYYNQAIYTVPELREETSKVERAKQAVGVKKISDKTQPAKSAAQIQADVIREAFAG